MGRPTIAADVRAVAYLISGAVAALVGLYLVVNPSALTTATGPVLLILAIVSLVTLWRANALLR